MVEYFPPRYTLNRENLSLKAIHCCLRKNTTFGDNKTQIIYRKAM